MCATRVALLGAAISVGLQSPAAAEPGLVFRASVPIPAAEIPAYDAAANMLYVTAGDRLAMLHLGDGDASLVRWIEVADAIGALPSDSFAINHVSVDPAGRAFAAVAVSPSNPASRTGWVVFVSTRTGANCGAVSVGYLPDALAFTADGAQLVVANEGEAVELNSGAVSDPAGSVSVIDLAHVRSAMDLTKLSWNDVRTVTFGGAALDIAVTGHDPSTALRIHPANHSTPALDIEPESITIFDGVAYITLQENNGVAALDLESLQWRYIRALKPIRQPLDPSDRDGGANVGFVIDALPMPDMLASFQFRGETFLVMANEGDRRTGALKDTIRLGDLAGDGKLSPQALSQINVSEEGAGRLNVCSFTGDLDDDGVIEAPHALGSRNLAVWRADTLQLVGHTTSNFESMLAELAPSHFNADNEDPNTPDTRSDDRGPEPEGLAIGEYGNNRMLAFVGLERPGAIAIVDITDPFAVRTIDVVSTVQWNLRGPEGLLYLPAAHSPTNHPMLIVAFETSGDIAVFDVIDR